MNMMNLWRKIKNSIEVKTKQENRPCVLSPRVSIVSRGNRGKLNVPVPRAKRVLAIVLTFLLVVGMVPFDRMPGLELNWFKGFKPIEAQAFAGGDGSEGNPYLVATAEQLAAISNTSLGAFYLQTADIDLESYLAVGGAGYNAGAGWLPIGTNASPFTGTYDGGGFEIRNLMVNRPTTDNVGLFGRTGNLAILKNIIVSRVNVTGKSQTGSLVGRNGGTINNSHATGSVSGTELTGGLVGENNKEIYNSSASVDVFATAFRAGGLVGQNSGADINSAVIDSCFATGDVFSTNQEVGGLLGINRVGTVRRSYALGNVTSNDVRVGGLVGHNGLVDHGGNIIDSYSTGKVVGSANVGGLVGIQSGVSSITNSFWNIQTSNQDTSVGGGTGKTTAQMRSIATFTAGAWSIEDSSAGGTSTWVISEDRTYPWLRETPMFAGGSGTPTDPFLVATAGQLKMVRANLAAHYKQTADIDLSIFGASYDGGQGWLPIGNDTAPTNSTFTGPRFTGSYDGDGYVIRNLYINRPSHNHVGLFGGVQNGTLRNIGLENAYVDGNLRVGALVGMFSGEISNSYSTGKVIGRQSQIGGLVGRNGFQTDSSSGVIKHSYSTATVELIGVEGVVGHTGGLVGLNVHNSRVEKSFATGNVTGLISESIGGLVGSNHQNPQIHDSYALGNVKGKSKVGGLVGTNDTDGTRIITNSYATGLVSLNGGAVAGGLIGQNVTGTNTITNSFWNIQTSNQDTSVGGGTGKTTAQMRSIATFTAGAWSIEDSSAGGTSTWVISEDRTYPWLRETPMFAGGSGTPTDPFLVATAGQLNMVRANLAAHYKQTADIDLSIFGANYDGGKGWLPIGTEVSFFTGSYDGNGYTISNLMINRKSSEDKVNNGTADFFHAGLFGRVDGSNSQKNIHLHNVDIKVNNDANIDIRVGGLAGQVNTASVLNCSVTGTIQVTGSAFSVGGLVGLRAFGGENSIVNSYAKVDISAQGVSHGLGGLVGIMGLNDTISKSFAMGNVTNSAGGSTGGLIGVAGVANYNSFVKDSYATGNVRGGTNTGGLVGILSKGSVEMTYSIGMVTGTGTKGGLVGVQEAGTTITNSFWNTETSGQATSAGGTGKTTDEMKTMTTFSGWNFIDIWEITEIVTYPRLLDLPMFAGGSGSVDDPFLVATPQQLDHVRNYLDAHFRQVSDIDLIGFGANYDGGKGWRPIGGEFTGSYDGGGYSISNLKIDRTGGQIGLFKWSSGRLENIHLTNIDIKNAQGHNVGSLVGSLRNDGKIINCSSTAGSVKGKTSGASIGGLVGVMVRNSLIQDSFSSLDVSTEGNCRNPGGLVGTIHSGTILNSFATGNVVASGVSNNPTAAGGLVGGVSIFDDWSGDYGLIIRNSYSTGNVTAGIVEGQNSYAGGLIAEISISNQLTVTIENTYSLGSVNGGVVSGGLIGATNAGTGNISITNSFWNTETSGQNTSAGGTGKTTDEMKTMSTFSGWNFIDIWEITEGEGYPYLKWQMVYSYDDDYGDSYDDSYGGYQPGENIDVTVDFGEPVNVNLPLDRVPNAAAAYSLRKLRTGYTGPAVRVRKGTSPSETFMDIGFVNGELDVTALLTFAGGGDAFVHTWYDQSGNGNNAVRGTEDNQPMIVSGGKVVTDNNKTSIQFDGGKTMTMNNVIVATDFSVHYVANPEQANGDAIIVGGNTGNVQLRMKNGGRPQLFFYDQSTSASSRLMASAALFSQASFVRRGSTVSFYSNGYDLGSGTAGNSIQIRKLNSWGSSDGGSRKQRTSEVIIYTSAISDPQRIAIERNQGSYFGINQPEAALRPMDKVSSAAAAYGLRKLRSSYDGFAIRVRRDSDNREQDIGFDKNGDLNLVALQSFVGSGSGFVSIWYDQSGNGRHAVQTTPGNQPRIVSGGKVEMQGNGKATLKFSGSQLLGTSYAVNGTGSFTGFAAAANTRNSLVGSTLDAVFYAGRGGADTVLSLETYNGFVSTSTRKVYAGDPFKNGKPAPLELSLGEFFVGSTRLTVNIADTTAKNFMIGAGYSSTASIAWYSHNDISEIIVYPTALSDTNRTAIEASQMGYYLNAQSNVIPPLDAVDRPAAAYGLRKLTEYYNGEAIRVRRDSDDEEKDIGFDAMGDLNTKSLMDFVGSGSGYVTTWYDQSGNGRHAVQAEQNNQPMIVNSGSVKTRNGQPTLTFDTQHRFLDNDSFNIDSIVTIFATLYTTTVDNNRRAFVMGNSGFDTNHLMITRGSDSKYWLGYRYPASPTAWPNTKVDGTFTPGVLTNVSYRRPSTTLQEGWINGTAQTSQTNETTTFTATNARIGGLDSAGFKVVWGYFRNHRIPICPLRHQSQSH
jgi:hypothetical protein